MKTTLEVIENIKFALEFSHWVSNRCIAIRSIEESDKETIDRAIEAIVYLAQEYDKVFPRRPFTFSHTMTGKEMIDSLLSTRREEK